MTDVKDDPREVLALLNSLGFVGITAPQLKAFMKDLKMHRKIKEHQRQERKEEMRNKILSKQESMLKEMLRDTLAEKKIQQSENILSSESSERHDESLVTIRVHCISDDGENEDIENETRYNIEARAPKREVHTNKQDRFYQHGEVKESGDFVESRAARRKIEQSKNQNRFKIAQASTDSSQHTTARKKQESWRKETQKPVDHNRDTAVQTVRPASAPDYTNETHIPKERSKSVASDPAGLNEARNNPSRCSTHSNTKSFIRPWRLQPDAQRAASARKSDPVALYQKYRREWKQISFPGEEQHARVRWAIREKMLGTDPHPKPILKSSQSLLSIKKR